MEFKSKLYLTVSALLLAPYASVQAMPPHLPNLVNGGNEWKVTAYVDKAPNHVVLRRFVVCFFNNGASGTHQQYTWASPSYPDWNGRAVQEGDQIFMYGDFVSNLTRDVGHSAMEWEIVTNDRYNVGAGHMEQWLEDGKLGSRYSFANILFQRAGQCQYHSIEKALEAGYSQELPVDEQGKYLDNPLGVVQKEVE
jgi:hypothetical protein